MIRVPKNRVGVIPITDPPKIGHIIVPDMAKERTDQGIVKYVGDECKYVTAGSYVFFSGYAGTVVKIKDPETLEEENIIIIPEDFIYGELVDFPSTDIPGLYFHGKDGTYFEATYAMAMVLISDALAHAEWRMWNPVTKSGINAESTKPTQEEYKQLKGG